MDIGDVICEKLRSNESLEERELTLIGKLTNMLKRIKLDEDIILYRGIKDEFDPIMAGKQFNAMTPDLKTAKTYGIRILKVIVPKGSNAFYISAWELINTEVGEQEEKEVLLLPGKFLLCGEEDGIVTYAYN